MRAIPKIEIDKPDKDGGWFHISTDDLEAEEYWLAAGIIGTAMAGIIEEDRGLTTDGGIMHVDSWFEAPLSIMVEISPYSAHVKQVHALAKKHLASAIACFVRSSQTTAAQPVPAAEQLPAFDVATVEHAKAAEMNEASR